MTMATIVWLSIGILYGTMFLLGLIVFFIKVIERKKEKKIEDAKMKNYKNY